MHPRDKFAIWSPTRLTLCIIPQQRRQHDRVAISTREFTLHRLGSGCANASGWHGAENDVEPVALSG